MLQHALEYKSDCVDYIALYYPDAEFLTDRDGHMRSGENSMLDDSNGAGSSRKKQRKDVP